MFHLRIAAVFAIALGALSTAQADIQQDFFQALQSGQVGQLTKQMRPELLVEIDEPVLNAWMIAINNKLGAVRKITKTGFEKERGLTASRETSTATVQFERGTATSSMKVVDGKLISFNVTAAELGDDWFQGPTDTKIYQEMGRTFIKRFLGGQTDDAYDMCHPALREAVDAETFIQMSQGIRENAGTLKLATFKDSRMVVSGDSQTLLLDFDIVCEDATGTCEIKVQFVGLKGHLLGYDFE